MVRHSARGSASTARAGSWPSKKLARLDVAETRAQQRIIPRALDAGDRQRHVDAVQRHEVDLPLPPAPIPPGGRVTVRAVVQIHPILTGIDNALSPRHPWQRPGQLKLIPAPGEMAVGVALEIPVQRRRHRNWVVASQRYPPAHALDLEHVAAAIGRNQLDNKILSPVPQDTPG